MKSKEFIDLRSDTVTLPTDEMLEAIRHAELGDDVFEEDSTVNQLQELAAEKTGKEAALLVPSGTQANLISLMSNCKRGELVFLEAESHIYWYEVGGISAVAGLLPWPLRTTNGAFDPAELDAAIRPKNIHFPQPTLVCVENTHNRHGGTITTPAQLEEIQETAERHSMKIYMDGARIFNASVGLGVNVKEFAKHVDNFMFCLSKGLCCPIGSVVVGTHEFIKKAKRVRKVLGGGMRQAGIIAAPGIIALEKMINRLGEDHDNAKFIAQALAKMDGVEINVDNVQTNIVIFELEPRISDALFLQKLKERGVLALAQSKNKIRLVTHYGIQREHMEIATAAIEFAIDAQ
jgi:threonine aldolase